VEEMTDEEISFHNSIVEALVKGEDNHGVVWKSRIICLFDVTGVLGVVFFIL
jgi:hypothetical protein